MADPLDVLQRGAEGRPAWLLLDGGLATELERRGADVSDALWSTRVLLDRPDLVRAVHDAYAMAGAEVLATATYQASAENLRGAGLTSREIERLFVTAVSLARAASQTVALERPAPLVAGSLGPYGATLADGSEYRGDDGRSVRALRAFHGPRVETMLAAAPDCLAFETIPSGREAEAIARVLDAFPEARAWVSFQCRDEEALADGTTLRDAVSLVRSIESVRAAGVNCVHPDQVLPLLSTVRDLGLPLVAYPNAGDRWDAGKRAWEPAPRPSPASLASLAPSWYAEGARLIGGCCRTTPASIRDLAQAMGRPDDSRLEVDQRD